MDIIELRIRIEDLNYFRMNRIWPSGKMPQWIRDSKYWKDEDCHNEAEVAYYELLEAANYLLNTVTDTHAF